MINILFFVCCLVTSSASHGVYGMQSTLQEDLKLERQSKLINKPPVKSFQTKFGYNIVDCIDINKQPAFDHPLLKNHKLQRKPSNQGIIENRIGMKKPPSKPTFGLETPCPKGTVPIRRFTKSDFIQSKSLSDAPQNTNNHVAEVRLKPQRPYYGVNGIVSVWNPKVEKDQSSAIVVWVRNEPTSTYPTNEIIAGWHVDPQLYGNFGTHFFAAWTADNYKSTGCNKVVCDGFIQVDSTHYLGALLSNTTDYNRNMVFELQISIFQDKAKNWWVNVENRDIGYFPASLFSNLASAERVGWGGRTTSKRIVNPPMGSGSFPNENLLQSCHFRSLSYKNEINFQTPNDQMTEAFSDKLKCYGANYFGYQKRIGMTILEVGGPGGYCEV